MHVEIREVPARRVAYLRALGRYPQTFPTLWPKFNAIANPLGLCSRPGLSIMHDRMGKVPDDQLRGDAAREVDLDWQPQGGLCVETIPGGRYAVTVHHGPYQTLHQTWMALYSQWLPTSGQTPRAAACYEVYVNDPKDVAPQALLTKIYVPIE